MADPPMRRLSAFNQACDGGYIDIAEMLLRTLELALTREGGADSDDKRTELGAVIDAYSRLLTLKSRG